MTTIVGIDLGTSKSALAIWKAGSDAPELVRDANGERCIVPSLVAYENESQKDRWLIGDSALDAYTRQPKSTISAIKRFMGLRFTDEAVKEEIALGLPYPVVESKAHTSGIEVIVDRHRLTPQEVSAKILRYLVRSAEDGLGHPINNAVVTVPAYFNDARRQATRDAGRIAGLEVRRVISEPTAACLAYGYHRLNEERHTVAVYDLGGGTFDISILEVGRGPFWVRATNGDTRLGGNDLDHKIVDWVLHRLSARDREELAASQAAMAKLRAAVKEAKERLSEPDTTRARIQVAGSDAPGPDLGDLDVELTREVLEALASDWVARTLDPCKRALRDAEVHPDDIKEVLLVGGQTRMPAIRRAVGEFFGREPDTSLNPEEVVALGAAVQGGILAGVVKGIKLADVVPLSLGLNTLGDKMNVLIPRNSPIPIVVEDLYTTDSDNQDSVDIEIYQGERPVNSKKVEGKAEDNIFLGKFTISGIEPAPARDPTIRVTFRVDEDGILEVTGRAEPLGEEHKVRITESTRLSDEEIEAMIQKAEEHRAEDVAKLQELAERESVKTLQKFLNRSLNQYKDRLPSDLVTDIQNALAASDASWVGRGVELDALRRRVRDALRVHAREASEKG